MAFGLVIFGRDGFGSVLFACMIGKTGDGMGSIALFYTTFASKCLHSCFIIPPVQFSRDFPLAPDAYV